jgi:hypothetical protein
MARMSWLEAAEQAGEHVEVSLEKRTMALSVELVLDRMYIDSFRRVVSF